MRIMYHGQLPMPLVLLRTPFNLVFLYSQIGDRVMAFVNYNAWAEVVCTPVEFVYKIPDDMSFSEAAAFPMNFVTAYTMLFEIANLREGMSVLVHSAGGGVVSLLLMVQFLQSHDGINGVETDNAVLIRVVVIGRNDLQYEWRLGESQKPL